VAHNGCVPDSSEAAQTLTSALDRLLAVIDETLGGAGVPAETRDEARAAALAMLEASGGASDARGSALVGHAAELLKAIAVDLAANPRDTVRPLEALERRTGVAPGLLEREGLPAGEHFQESVLSTVERRLARLRFDLHDGPQQDLHLLAEDLRLFREQLRPMIAGAPDEHRAMGRLDDLEAQLVALDGDLRRLLSSVQSPLLVPGSLSSALGELTDAFAARTGVVPETTFADPMTPMTDSQQIALLSLIREALSNIRRHSNARHVQIAIGSGSDGAHVVVSDDGTGFDPETTLVRAARGGHLGLVGMHERVRMLGGRTQIDSRPGGPTVVSATLPPWPEVVEA
jgi:signal transduction histidine kinase